MRALALLALAGLVLGSLPVASAHAEQGLPFAGSLPVCWVLVSTPVHGDAHWHAGCGLPECVRATAGFVVVKVEPFGRC